MNRRLHYRRQFLLSNTRVMGLSDWKCLQIDKHYLYAHPDIEVNQSEDPQKVIVLIGNLYDSKDPQKGNDHILEDITAEASSLERLILWMKRYAGRYTVLYKDDKNTVMLPDALALREVYYCTKENQVICGSQPNLVATFSNPQIEMTNDADLLDFYRNHSINSKWDPTCKWLGDETYFECIKHLLPNHYLDIKRREVRRFWPNEAVKSLDIEEAVSKSCSFLQGNISAMASRHPVMMAVTAGTDTRTLLAASKGVKDKIYYFVNNQGLGHSHPDISIPIKISKGVGLPLHVHDVPKDVPDDFRSIFLNNTFYSTERILPTIFNVYFKNHSKKVNILGIGEIGRSRFGKEPQNLNGYRMAYKLGHKEDRYAILKSEQILAEMLPAYRKFGVNVMTGFYWEQYLGNWGSTGNSESDIAIEEVNPTNSHELYEIFLGVDDKYTKYNGNILFPKMIHRMWPELLEWPINPPRTMRDKGAWLLKKVGMFELLKELKYKLNHVKYLYSAGK